MVNKTRAPKICPLAAQLRCPEHFLWQICLSLDPPLVWLAGCALKEACKSANNDQVRSQCWMQLFQAKRASMQSMLPATSLIPS